ncbi:MAG TPA: nuclear transport factor 2 family protein [Blastocatellia bacterium]|nr:nuclear transport factor 2 family protein [Blastocatellia bacterium]
MSKIALEMAAVEVARTVLTHLRNGEIDEAINRFSDALRFKDHGLGLEFNNKEGLAEFFRKTRALYPEHLLETDTVFASGDRVIMEWTLLATITEPFYGAPRKFLVSVRGVSIVRTEDGKISDWADYYDGRTSRRNALAAQFEDWI